MKLSIKTLSMILILMPTMALTQIRFGEKLCQMHPAEYQCIKIKAHEHWDNLFPDLQSQDLVRRLNRMNIPLRPGMIIAIPRHLENLSIYDISPFPRYIEPQGERTIFVNQSQLAWGAYDDQGQLIWWGPTSSGSEKCAHPEDNCSTPSGSFRVIRKQDIDCISTVFPVNEDGTRGGAIMPYCMHFFRGFALHGSEVVPGYNDSHGCIRLFIEDARWLNEEFIFVPGTGLRGTRVIVVK